ncbi:MAG TPA: hypothetical protein VNX28_10660 [Gemmataceae bacterium]|jgi:hypothetical protein|nr:hypothetical protein [Gemmataceae bacterium]
MTAFPAALEERLLRGYQDQLPHYDRAATILERYAGNPNAAASDNWAHELRAALADVTRLDAAMAEDKSAWRLAELQPGPELRAVLERVAARLATLAAGVQRHVADLEARRAQLLPEIDDFIQKRRMLQAYGKYGDRPAHVAKTC